MNNICFMYMEYTYFFLISRGYIMQNKAIHFYDKMQIMTDTI